MIRPKAGGWIGLGPSEPFSNANACDFDDSNG